MRGQENSRRSPRLASWLLLGSSLKPANSKTLAVKDNNDIVIILFHGQTSGQKHLLAAYLHWCKMVCNNVVVEVVGSSSFQLQPIQYFSFTLRWVLDTRVPKAPPSPQQSAKLLKQASYVRAMYRTSVAMAKIHQ